VVIERFGKLNRVLDPGLHFKIPLIENTRGVEWIARNPHTAKPFRCSTRSIDLREQVHPLPSQHVITKDNVAMDINGLVYYKITDVKDAVYGVEDLPTGIEKLSLTTLREVVGGMFLDDTLESRDKINQKLRAVLDEATHNWGVQVTRVELQEVSPPESIVRAMERQMSSERDKRADVIIAEGDKLAQILRAEGLKEAVIRDAEATKAKIVLAAQAERESAILRAEGERKSLELIAEGEAYKRERLGKAEAAALMSIGGATSQSPAAYLLAKQYVESLPEMIKGGNVAVVPYDAMALAGALTAAKEVLNPK